MRLIPFFAAAALVLPGCAAVTKGGDAHAAHHAVESASAADTGKTDQQMKAMQEMHQKMMAAKTPEERAALMKDHMNAMQDGMATTGQMKGTGTKGGPGMDGDMSKPGGRHDMMMRRMDMMEMMMQMMMDREGMKTPAAK